MKIVLERNLDYKQFQNLFILTFVSVFALLGMVNSTALNEYIYLKIILFFFVLLFILILFTKKGLLIKNNKLRAGVFLFGMLIINKNIETNFEKFTLLKGKLSTNYNYSYDITEFHNWEPDLNHSIESFTITLLNQNHTTNKKLLILSKENQAKNAIDFIMKNTNLKYEKYSPC
jgi:hypothetical protein